MARLDLPAELRVRVYEFAMAASIRMTTTRETLYLRRVSRLKGYISDVENRLCFISTTRLIRDEAQPLFWKRTVLVIPPRDSICLHSLALIHNIVFSRSRLEVIEGIELNAREWQHNLANASARMPRLRHIELRIEAEDRDYNKYPFSVEARSIIRQMAQFDYLSDTSRTLHEYFKLWLLTLDVKHRRHSQVGTNFPALLARYTFTVRMTDSWLVHCLTKTKYDNQAGLADYSFEVTLTLDLHDGTTTPESPQLDGNGSFTHHVGNIALETSYWMDCFHRADPQGGWNKFGHTVNTWVLDILLFKLFAERGLLKVFRERPCISSRPCRLCEVIE